MGSSPGFVSNPSDCLILRCVAVFKENCCANRRFARPLQTRFRSGSGCLSLNLATEINSLAHSPKGTPSHLSRRRYLRNVPALIVLRPFVSTRFQVLFHSLYQGPFHLSLTVLVRYRSSNVFSLGRWTSLLPTELACSVVLRTIVARFACFVYGAVTLFGASFQLASTTTSARP